MPGGMTEVSELPKGKRQSLYPKLQVCSDFVAGNCSLGENCSLPHPSESVAVVKGYVTICYDSVRKHCDRESCKFYHPSAKVFEKMETFGRKFTSAALWNKTNVGAPLTISIGPHSPPGGPITPSPPMQASPISPGYFSYQQHYQQQWQPPTYISRYRYDKSDRLPVCRDFIKNICNRTDEECKYAHPGDDIIFDENDSTVIVCMDFIKGSCTRPFCKYLHPPAHLQEQVRNRQNKSLMGTYYPVVNTPAALIPTMVPQQSIPPPAYGGGLLVNQPPVQPVFQQSRYQPVSYMPMSYPIYQPYPSVQTQSVQWFPNIPMPPVSTVVPALSDGGEAIYPIVAQASIQPAVDHTRE